LNVRKRVERTMSTDRRRCARCSLEVIASAPAIGISKRGAAGKGKSRKEKIFLIKNAISQNKPVGYGFRSIVSERGKPGVGPRNAKVFRGGKEWYWKRDGQLTSSGAQSLKREEAEKSRRVGTGEAAAEGGRGHDFRDGGWASRKVETIMICDSKVQVGNILK